MIICNAEGVHGQRTRMS